MVYYFKVNASNSQNTSQKQVSFKVWEPPVITTSSLPNATRGSYYNQTINADGTEYTMRWEIIGGSLPPGLSFKADDTSVGNRRKAKIVGTPTSSGIYSFTVKLYNLVGNPETTTTKNFTISVEGYTKYDDPNLATYYTFGNGTVGKSYSDWVVVKSTYDGSLSYNSSGRPDGLQIRRSGRSIYLEGTPQKAGTYELTLTPHKSDGGYHDNKFTIVINPAQNSRAFEDSSMSTVWNFYYTGEVGRAYSDWISVRGGSSPYTCSVVKGILPPGLTLRQSGSTTFLEGTPTRSGNYSFTVRIIGSHNGYVEKACTMSVNANSSYRSGDAGDGSSSKPKFSSKTLPNAAVGTEWETMLNTYVYGTTPITFFAAESLPEGFMLDEETGRLSGIPLEAGKYKFRIKAENAIGSTIKTLKLKAVAQKPTILTTTLPDGYVNGSYEVTLDFSGTKPIKFKKSGSLPSGLKLNKKTGVISGTPKKADTYEFSVTAKNKSGSDTVNLKITINEKEPTKDGVESSSMANISSLSLTENSNVQNNASSNSENKGSGNFTTELYLISGDEELKDCITTEAEKPLTFAIDEWIDAYGRSVEVSNVKVFINEEPLDDLEISDEGVFTLSGDIVNNEFIIYATALTGSQELRTSEVNIIVGNQEKNISSSEYDNKQNDDKNSSGGCNINFLGIICMMIFGVVMLRKNY